MELVVVPGSTFDDCKREAVVVCLSYEMDVRFKFGEHVYHVFYDDMVSRLSTEDMRG